MKIEEIFSQILPDGTQRSTTWNIFESQWWCRSAGFQSQIENVHKIIFSLTNKYSAARIRIWWGSDWSIFHVKLHECSQLWIHIVAESVSGLVSWSWCWVLRRCVHTGLILSDGVDSLGAEPFSQSLTVVSIISNHRSWCWEVGRVRQQSWLVGGVKSGALRTCVIVWFLLVDRNCGLDTREESHLFPEEVKSMTIIDI